MHVEPIVPPKHETGYRPESTPKSPVSGRFATALTRAAAKRATAKQPPLYRVQQGDTLSEIVHREFKRAGLTVGTAELYAAVSRVAAYNGIANPDLIVPGQSIDLSPLDLDTVKFAQTRPVPLDPLGLGQGGIKHSGATSRLAALVPSRIERHRWAPVNEDAVSPWKAILADGARLSSVFGRRNDPFTGECDFHDGIDLAAPSGSSIRAMSEGEVIFSGWRDGYGNLVVVRHADGLETAYGHNKRNLVNAGDHVTADTEIALVGSTGRSTGPHVHFEVRKNGRPVNPVPYLKNASLRVAEAS